MFRKAICFFLCVLVAVSSFGLNIENLSNGSRGDYAYTIVELGVDVPDGVEEAIAKIDGVVRTRVIN